MFTASDDGAATRGDQRCDADGDVDMWLGYWCY